MQEVVHLEDATPIGLKTPLALPKRRGENDKEKGWTGGEWSVYH